jgi:hypothetical protein
VYDDNRMKAGTRMIARGRGENVLRSTYKLDRRGVPYTERALIADLGSRFWVWVVASGMIGGCLSAFASHNARLFPTVVETGIGSRLLLRVGLIVNMCIGAAGSLGVVLPVILVCAPTAHGSLLPVAIAGVIYGFVAARCVTIVLANRVLRVAVCMASASPAAHPDTVHVLRIAPPEVLYRTVEGLVPRHASRP